MNSKKTLLFRILSIIGGFSVLSLILITSVFGILTDYKTGAVSMILPDDDVTIDLNVTPSNDTVTVEQGEEFDTFNISVTSTGKKECYVIVEVDVPIVSYTSSSGTADTASIISLEINDNEWEYIDARDLLNNPETDEGTGTVVPKPYYRYVYGYKGDNAEDLKMLGEYEVTGELVSRATFADFGTAFKWEGEIVIKAWAVQTNGYDPAEPDVVWHSVVEMHN